VTTIKNYLFAKDIPAEAIFLDFAGLDTYDSMYRAQYIFQVQSLLIPTQAFHVDRAVFLARRLGIDAYGTITDTYTLPQIERLHLREFFARGKAWRDILV
jgi:SanA protein